MTDQLPFRVEYAKSGRASCKSCKGNIGKDDLRLAKISQSPFHDGVMTSWFHPDCFFAKTKPKTIGDIANFDNIKWEDQEMVRKRVEGGSEPAAGSSGKGRKRGNNEALKDFKIEYAKSNRSVCVGCETPIIKDNIRVSKKDYDSEKAVKFGSIDRWHHLECFAQIRNELEFFVAGNNLPGFKTLKKEDQDLVKKTLPAIKETGAPAVKKVKEEPVDSAEEKIMKKQNKKLFDTIDKLKVVKKKDMIEILQHNNQFVPDGESRLRDSLADQLVFGALPTCTKCSGQFRFKSGIGYRCMGNITEWTKCENIVVDPKRTKFIISDDIKEKYDFLKAYKSKPERRIVRITAPSAAVETVKKEDQVDGPKVNRGPMPLRGMQFVIAGRTEKSKEALKKEIMSLGGTVGTKVSDTTAAVIANEAAIEKGGKVIEEAEKLDIQVVSEDFVDEAKDYKDTPIPLIIKKNICSWGGDPSVRVVASLAKSSSSVRAKSIYEKSGSGKVKLKIKGGGAVDPDSELEDVAHVFQRGNEKFTVTLGITDIQAKKNSYYKLQILKHDHQNKYWLFRSWGRIGTTIGGHKTESMALEDCISTFKELYHEKSGNHWENRDMFVKYPRLMYPIDTEDSDDSKVGTLESNIESKLKKPVQDLIRLIFDVNIMKKVMKEFEIDTEKMPLGKLSKKQLEKAYQVLTELQQLITKGNAERMLIIDASNRFYTLVPHSFGVGDPPLLDTEEIIKTKCEMLESLIDMEIAYNLLSVKTDENQSPLDAHYAQLNTDIDVLDKDSDEYKMIETYTKNTHAATHSSYELEIENVFVVKRKGEDKRYKPFAKLPNKKLLWHGSRTTNYAGILSQGLRIAPPEAPVTGYMFGKGIYFADMVSKSANYCCTNSQDSTGLLLLCEVALGNMYERLKADYIEKLPKGKHSTFGKGQTGPDPNQVYKTPDGVEVPYGPPVDQQVPGAASLLYNEYIVYDVAQVKAQYLVRMKFKYKY
ncbi:poly [ADP-ribose] polymerase-like [Microplitis mediator]|uniref:poly [ADP-ribose] polymerase-like n=1 Tax=Microplitis mediator TaxID=375433 RepID=UPI002554D707|nr:poly [ADP-ribose] polymerase-like [Microplitis mediator]